MFETPYNRFFPFQIHLQTQRSDIIVMDEFYRRIQAVFAACMISSQGWTACTFLDLRKQQFQQD